MHIIFLYHRNILLMFVVCACFTLHAQTTPDPALPGPHTVIKVEYNLGDLAYNLPSFPHDAEVRGNVHYPEDLSGGPYPVLVFLHGRHSTCFKPSTGFTQMEWPCEGAYESITSFEGYDYLGQLLASHGYIVISISANAINADDAYEGDSGMNARGELIQHHLDLWNEWNTSGGGPFDTLFVGKLDLGNVGTMGHSRGGEGVVFNALLNESLGSPYGIHAVLALAPVNFHREIIPDIPFMNIAPYCDGDVYDLQGVHYLDDARYTEPVHHSPKFSVLMLGANHNFYNTVWTPGEYPAGTADDWDDYWDDNAEHCGTESSGNGRLTEEEQRAALTTYACAFFRVYIGDETEFLPILTTEDITPPASSMLEADEVFVSYHPSDTLRMDINRTTEEENEEINFLNDSVHENNLTDYEICGGGLGMDECGITSSQGKAPHESFYFSEPGLAQQKLHWNNAEDYYENDIAEGSRDFRAYRYLQFRTAVNYDASPEGEVPDFRIQLTDASGDTSSVLVTNYTNALYFPPGNTFYALPKILFNTVAIPLTAFAGIQLNGIQKIRYVFNEAEDGAILISDLALSGSMHKNFEDLVLEGEIINPVPELQSVLSIFPNPAHDALEVYASNSTDGQTELKIFDMQGNLVEEKFLQLLIHTQIDVSKYAAGVYILQASRSSGTSYISFVKE